MLGVFIKNKPLDLLPGTTIEFVRNNPAFMGDDINEQLGSYSIPINIPLSKNNRELLNFPDRLDNNNHLLKDEACHVRINGIVMFEGLATIRTSNKVTARFYLIIDSYKKLKESSIQDLELGIFSFDDVPSILSNAKDTTLNPLDYPYGFFPILNKQFFSDDEREEINNPPEEPGEEPVVNENKSLNQYLNFYDSDTQQFVSDRFQKIAMPFVRVEHILNKIGDFMEFDLDSQLTTSDEMKSLYLYNDRSIYLVDDWNVSFDLSDHVPNIKISDTLKRISRLFCAGVFIDQTKKKIEIIPLNNILNRPYKHDWTKFADEDYENATPANYPGVLSYDSTDDSLFDINEFKELSPSIEVDLHPEIVNANQGWYYVKTMNTYVWSNQHPFYPFGEKRKMFRKIFLGDGKPVEFKASPLFQQQTIIDEITQVQHDLRDVPEILQSKLSNKDLRLTFYRGMHLSHSNKLYPFASNNIFDGLGNELPNVNYSLLWNGPKGMYESWWKEWIEFLTKKKEVQRIINLHIKEILNFSFQDKVLIENIQYFVKQMRVVVSSNGIQTTKCKLISVL